MSFQDTKMFPPFEIHNAFAGTIVYPPGGQLGPRVQSDLQLVLLHSGSIDIKIDDHEYAIVPGNVLLLKPGHREKFEFARKEDTWHRWITVRVTDSPALEA